ncbi:DUF2059 domain-containing protein [Loktanella sp. SALINAS62]|uniref:DUF2059 domain-containing protein n=1 Tax=Loktanella sp. SALINAS62 TaxID=2706124 RepID=UPI001B8D3D12|nr:DUF2059 domain-containing protein [Loktanella sp. SALINAS62]MBS1302768.1 DUF2059 domain-containing protein [Loktanella sp. SALINAS62]
MLRALRRQLTAVIIGFVATTAAADTIDSMFDAMRMDEMVDLLRDEGLDYGTDIAEEMFTGPPSVAWAAAVDAIFDAGTMAETLRARIGDGLDKAEIAQIAGFYQSELGQQLVALEMSARKAMLDPSIEEAAMQAATEAVVAGGPRIEMMKSYIKDNGIIEAEVASNMNASVAFYVGLLDGGAVSASVTEQDILNDVYSRQDDIRDDVMARIHAYLFLAYRPLSDAQLDQYIHFAQSASGQALNAAMYDAFDSYYIDASRQLALAAAAQMQGADL